MRTSEAALADDAARHLRASCDQISAMLQRQRMADEEAAIAAVKRRFGTPVVDEPAGSSCVEALDSAIEAGVEQGLLARELSDAECRIERLAAQLAHTQHQLAAALAREDGLRRSLEEVLGQHLTGSRPCANGLLMAWANTHLPAPHMCGKPPADPPQPLSARSESEERGGGSPIPEGASTPTWLRRAAALIPECDLEWDLGITPGAPPAQTAPAAASQTPLTADSASVAIACAATGAATRTVDATANSPYTSGGAPSGWSSPLEQQPQVAAPIERPRAAREAAARVATAAAVAAARVPLSLSISLDPPGALPPPALAATQTERVPPDLARGCLGGSASCSSAGRGSHGATPLDNGVRTAGTATATGAMAAAAATWHVTTTSPTRMAAITQSPTPAQLPPPPPAAQVHYGAAQVPPSPLRRDGSGPVMTTLSPSTNARHQIERARRTIDGWQATAADFLKVSHHSQTGGSKEIGPPITFY